MQTNSVYLYPNKIDVFTNVLDEWVGGYRKVYQRNLKFYRGVDNKVILQLKNGDQKAVPLNVSNNEYIVFNLVSEETKGLILQKDGTLANDSSANKGQVTVTLTEAELQALETGMYRYSAHVEIRDPISPTEYTVTSKSPLYVDSQYGVIGTLEIAGDVLGDVHSSLVVDKFLYTNPQTQGEEQPKFYISSIIDARPILGTSQSLHTFQLYCTNYSGTVKIQGSIDEQGATPSTWVDIEIITLTSATLAYQNITGKYNWFRIYHLPTAGTLDKVLYR